ncbi:MAG: Gldg family protein [Arenicella sp.]|nr:Gldg family protein [Arenicella sp.]
MKLSHNNTRALLFVLGIICLTWSSVSWYVEQSIDSISIALLALGISSLLICVMTQYFSSQRRFHFSQWRKRGITTIVILMAFIFTVGVNVFAYSLEYRWDLTLDKQHTLTKSTIDFVKGTNKSIELTALYVGLPPKYLEDLFNEYERVSNGNITTTIIDPLIEIGQAAQFGNVISSNEKKLVIQSGSEKKEIDFSESSLTEEQLTNALIRVTRPQRQVYFLTGHGELSFENEDNQGLAHFSKLLEANNISSKNLMLGIENQVPDDCDVLIIAGPRTDLTEKEQRLIGDYLNQGGDALFLIENVVVTTPDQPITAEQEGKNPSLNSILNQWGVNVENDIVVDLSSHIGGDVGSPATRNYINHKAITAGLDYSFYVRPRSISVLAERRSTIRLAPIVLTQSKEKSWGETNRTLAIHFDEGIDTPGPVAISYVIWEEKEEDEISDTRIIVFTDADFISNVYLDRYSNASMGLNVVNWLSELDYTVFLDQKEVSVERLDLTSKQRRMITALLFFMPLLIAVGGIFVWMIRGFRSTVS